jgi:hypothetical protein
MKMPRTNGMLDDCFRFVPLRFLLAYLVLPLVDVSTDWASLLVLPFLRRKRLATGRPFMVLGAGCGWDCRDLLCSIQDCPNTVLLIYVALIE